MKNRFKMAIAMALVAVLGFSTAAVLAIDYEVPEGASTKTARFNVMEDMPASGDVEFSMISEDGELVIHISPDTPVYFDDYVPMGDEADAGMTRDAREVLFGRTLAEVLDNRNLVVTYAITTRSIPPQTSPISVRILFETAVHLPIDVDGGYQGITTLPGTIDPILSFIDVNADEWFYTPITWAYENGIMNGMSPTHFAPNGTMTRAMLVTVLWRYAGQPSAGAPAFADVQDGHWYSTAIAWAAESGVVTGFSPTVFAPQDYINREQMYTILYRYMNHMGFNIALEEEMRLQQFADDNLVSDWAREALMFMFDAGVMFRYNDFDNYARPQQDATRGEIAGAMFFFDMRTN